MAELRCRPGDLAVIVDPSCPTVCGMSLTVLELATDLGPRFSREARIKGLIWRVDRLLPWYSASEFLELPYCPDGILMPIRPEPDPEEVPNAQEAGA